MPIAQDAPIRRVTTTLISSVCRLSRISGGKTATIAAGSCTRPTTRLTECRKDDRPRRPPSREAESFANRGRARPFRLTQRHEQPVADERQSENIAESERLGAMAAARCAVRRSSGSGRPCARPDLLAGWARAMVRPGGRVARRSPHRCSAAWRSAPVRKRRALAEHPPPARRRWLPSLGQAGRGARFLPLSVTACCRIRALLSSARLARGRLAGTRGRCCEDTTPCAAGLLSSTWAF